MPASEYILKHLFQNDPIRWLNEGAFSAASMKKIKRFTVVCCVICRIIRMRGIGMCWRVGCRFRGRWRPCRICRCRFRGRCLCRNIENSPIMMSSSALSNSSVKSKESSTMYNSKSRTRSRCKSEFSDTDELSYDDEHSEEEEYTYSINSDENDENDNEEVHLSLDSQSGIGTRDLPNRMEMLRTSWQLD